MPFWNTVDWKSLLKVNSSLMWGELGQFSHEWNEKSPCRPISWWLSGAYMHLSLIVAKSYKPVESVSSLQVIVSLVRDFVLLIFWTRSEMLQCFHKRLSHLDVRSRIFKIPMCVWGAGRWCILLCLGDIKLHWYKGINQQWSIYIGFFHVMLHVVKMPWNST